MKIRMFRGLAGGFILVLVAFFLYPAAPVSSQCGSLASLILGEECEAEPEGEEEEAEEGERPSFLFVVNAQGGSYEGSELILSGVAEDVVFFSNRPQRIAGHQTMEVFVGLWDEGSTFFVDPPNAALTWVEEGE